MCGIAGFIKYTNNVFNNKEILSKFTEKLAHRGPDSSDYWISEDKREQGTCKIINSRFKL